MANLKTPSSFQKQCQQSSNPLKKIATYETFLNETLKTDLKNILDQREQVFLKVSEYLEQEIILKKLAANNESTHPSSSAEISSMRLRVDLGCNFYAQAEVANTQSILFDMGCGIWLNVSLKEGLNFCQKHIKRLNNQIEFLTKKELQIKSQINIVIEALKQLQGITDFTEEPILRNTEF